MYLIVEIVSEIQINLINLNLGNDFDDLHEI